MQNDLLPELPPSGGYEKIVTAMHVFSRYLFAYPICNQDAKSIAKVLVNILTMHAYLPTTPISDKSTAFMSHVTEEVAGVLGITLQHSTKKHVQTIRPPERSHASIKQALNVLKQASEDHCGTNTSALRSLNKTLLIRQILAVSHAEFFTAA